MNFYNPYLYSLPAATSASTGLLSKLSFGSILNGTTKALNFVNQAIPVVKQISPIMKNAKTMFRVMNEFKKNDTSVNNTINSNKVIEPIDEGASTPKLPTSNGPTFFV